MKNSESVRRQGPPRAAKVIASNRIYSLKNCAGGEETVHISFFRVPSNRASEPNPTMAAAGWPTMHNDDM